MHIHNFFEGKLSRAQMRRKQVRVSGARSGMKGATMMARKCANGVRYGIVKASTARRESRITMLKPRRKRRITDVMCRIMRRRSVRASAVGGVVDIIAVLW